MDQIVTKKIEKENASKQDNGDTNKFTEGALHGCSVISWPFNVKIRFLRCYEGGKNT
jgi:hypothetical protein